MPTNFSNPYSLTNPTGLNATTADGAYSDNMWWQLGTLKDPYIQSQLARKWRTDSVWRAMNMFTLAMRNANGSVPESMTIKGVFDLEPTVEPIGVYQIWLPNNYVDTYSQTIYFKHYGDKVGLHKYDDMVQAYTLNNRVGMANLAKTMLGESATKFMDRLIRNAYLEVPFVQYTNGHTDFSGMSGATQADHFDPAVALDIWMNLTYQGLPLAQSPNGTNGNLICITTPSVIRDIQAAAGSEWMNVYQYANPGALLRYEVGSYKNVRYVADATNVLWNVGDIIWRGTLAADANPGDGASDDLVDKVYNVGQPSGVSKGLDIVMTVDDTTALAVNQIITIHNTVTSDNGVTDGVNFKEGTARQRRIVKVTVVDSTHARIYFDRPLHDAFAAGTYVTFGEDIHPSVFIGGPQTVVTGVGSPIETHAIAPNDDVEGIWRFSWDGYFDTALYRPESAVVAYSSGTAPKYGIA